MWSFRYGSTHTGAAKALAGKGHGGGSHSNNKSPSAKGTPAGRGDGDQLSSKFGTVRPKSLRASLVGTPRTPGGGGVGSSGFGGGGGGGGGGDGGGGGGGLLSITNGGEPTEEELEAIAARELDQTAAQQAAAAVVAPGSNVSEVVYATEVEFVMPMVVVVGTLELTATHLSFEGRQFGGPGTGVGVSNEKIDWVPDADRSECALCRKPFSGLFKTGKHHCRACGDIYCAACSDYKKPLPRLGLCEPVRVCATCFTDSGTLQRGRRRRASDAEYRAGAGGGGGGGEGDDADIGSWSGDGQDSSSEGEDDLEALASGLVWRAVPTCGGERWSVVAPPRRRRHSHTVTALFR
jgi:hypothetical protein